jgi:type II secretion system protein G
MKKGFTLMELLVTIAIISILTAIILPNLTAARAKSRDQKRISDISNLQLALELYLNKYGKYPIDEDGGTNGLAANANFIGRYMSEIPVDPLNTDDAGNDNNYTYSYKTNATGTTYCLGATFETTNADVNTSNTCDSGNADNEYKVSK